MCMWNLRTFSMFQSSQALEASKEMQCIPTVGEWTRRDIQHCRFKNYDLTYAFYSKFPSWGFQVELCAFTAKTVHPIHLLSFPSRSEFYSIFSKHSVFRESEFCKFFVDTFPSLAEKLVKMEKSKHKKPTKCFDTKKFTNKLQQKCSKDFSNSRSHFVSFSALGFYFNAFSSLFAFNDFGSPLILFSWWRNKISWD